MESSGLASRGGSVFEHLSGLRMVSKPETTSNFLSDSELITSNHLDLESKSESIVDSLFGIVTGRVEDSEETDKFESIAFSFMLVMGEFLVSDSQ